MMNRLYGETIRHNIQRAGRLDAYGGDRNCFAAMNETVYSVVRSGTANAAGYCLTVGDVFPAFGLYRGTRHARLAVGQRIGR